MEKNKPVFANTTFPLPPCPCCCNQGVTWNTYTITINFIYTQGTFHCHGMSVAFFFPALASATDPVVPVSLVLVVG